MWGEVLDIFAGEFLGAKPLQLGIFPEQSTLCAKLLVVAGFFGNPISISLAGWSWRIHQLYEDVPGNLANG